MSKELEILEVLSQPWQWVPDVDGAPARDVSDFLRLGSPDGCLRHFSYAFASRSPDVVFDRVSVDLGKLRAVIAEVENAVYAMIGGQSGGMAALKSAGEALSRMVFPAWVARRLFGLQEGTPFIVRPDELAAAIPFELCYDRVLDRFLCWHLAMARGVASRRRISLTEPRSTSLAGAVDLKHGVVALNPENDVRLSSSAVEAVAINNHLPDGYGAWLSICSGSPLPEFLSLFSTPCFIYTGHIRYNRELGSYIECSDGHRLNSVEIGRHLKGGMQPSLAVLNGCGGDRVDMDAIATDISGSATRAGLARTFYESGSLVAIGARWEVDLATACALSKCVLLNLTHPNALSMGELLRRFRLNGDPGWACYTLYGDPQTVFKAACQSPALPTPRPPDVSRVPAMRAKLSPCIPTWRDPLFVGLAIEMADQDKGTDAEKNLAGFLDAAWAEMNSLDARLAPHRGKTICHVGVECRPVLLNDWVRSHLTRLPGERAIVARRQEAHRGGGLALEALRKSFMRWARDARNDLTVPLFVLLLTDGGMKRMVQDDPDYLAKLSDLQRAFAHGVDGTLEMPPIWIIALDAETPAAGLLELAGGGQGCVARIEDTSCCSRTVRNIFSRYEPAAHGGRLASRSSGGGIGQP